MPLFSKRNASFALLIFALLALGLSCKEKDEETPDNGDGGAIPAGVSRIAGRAVDGSGNGLSDVDFRVIYNTATAQPEGDPLIGAVSIFSTSQTLTTQCNGNIPLADGISVRVFWDQNNNGIADASDPQPPLCSDPPLCESGPARTVNFNEFLINGQAVDVGPGKFYSELAFSTVGDIQDPSRYFLRIYCNDGAILYTSQLVDIPEGPSEIDFQFTCDSCGSPPVIPEWALGQAYPNPATQSAQFYFGLREAAVARLLLQRFGSMRIDTLLNEQQPSGGHMFAIDLAARANGLYEYRYSAAGYNNQHTLLKNERDLVTVRSQEALTRSVSNGDFLFDIAGGAAIDLRDSTGLSQGFTTLNSVRVIASKTGYIEVDSTVTVQGQDSLYLVLTLNPR